MTETVFLQILAFMFAMFLIGFIGFIVSCIAERIDRAMPRHPSASHLSLDELLED